MEQRLQKIWDTIFGNGGDGLKTDVAINKQKIEDMEDTHKSIAISLSGINKYITEQETRDSIAKETERLKRQSKRQSIMQIIMVAGIVASILIGIFK